MSNKLLVLKSWIHFFSAKISNLSRFSLISIFFLIFCSGQTFSAVQQIVIHWSTDLKLGSEVFLQNSDGTPISSGKGYNGDGCLVTLGYFDQSNDANPFLGNWIPLTTGTKFGDSSTGYGFPDGHFYVTSIFSKNSDVVEIYPSEPAYYEAFAPTRLHQHCQLLVLPYVYVFMTARKLLWTPNLIPLPVRIGNGPLFLPESRIIST